MTGSRDVASPSYILAFASLALLRRSLGLETTALVEEMLEPDQVARLMAAADSEPEKGFGELARERGVLGVPELDYLRAVREEGTYSQAKLSRARSRLLEALKRERHGTL